MSVLVAVDFSKNSLAAVRTAARLARRLGQPLVAVHCVVAADEVAFWRHLIDTPEQASARMREVAEARLRERINEVLRTDELPNKLVYQVELRGADEGIVAAARAHDVDLIVLGTTGLGAVERMVMGSTAERVIRTSHLPVLAVAPSAPDDHFHTVLAPVDLTDHSRVVLGGAIDFARAELARLLVMHAFALPTATMALLDLQPPAETIDAFEQRKWREFDGFLADFDFTGIDLARLLRISTPAAAIRSVVADEQVDLVCMGTHARRGMQRLLLGSTASKLVRRPPCSIMVLPGPE